MKLVRVSVLTTAIGLALCGGMSVSADLQAAGSRVKPGATAQTTGRYIITFAEKGLVAYKGEVSGLSRTAPSPDLVGVHSSRKLDAKSSAAVSYREYLAANRDQHVSAIEHMLGRRLTVLYTYDVTRNAISVAMSPAEAAKILGVPGVKAVSAVGIKQPDTFRSPTFIGANTIWDGTNVPSYASATRGQGIKVGVIDTGAYALHPSFANDPTCGFSVALPKLVEKDCILSSTCTGPTPEADANNGHGVHTSSTAAGNTIDNTVSPAPLLPTGVTMSGVAPCAQVHSYKICDLGGCYDDAIAAAIQNAILDQVDVINFSIGPTCGGGDPWVSTDTLDFLAAESADVFVAASAGNTRTQCTNPTTLVANNGPWMTTVAASTHDQIISPQISVVGPGTPPPATQNVPLISGSTTLKPASTVDLNSFPLRDYAANVIGCTSTGGIPAGTFTGSIAMLRRGSCSFTEKITNAFNAGATMVLIGNNQPGSISMNTAGAPTTIASFSMSMVQGDAIIAFLDANPAPALADYRRAAISSVQGDVLAGFSFRGPTPSPYDDLTKPDITGPGVNVYAAYDQVGGDYTLLSGTSMSSPHLAGSGALVRAVHPNWSPMEVKSALQTTATLVGFQEDGVTPWTVDQVGSGRVDLTKAALAGLTLDETPEHFAAANPNLAAADTIFANGFDPEPHLISGLNLASLRDANCATTCTWTRKFRNRLTTSGTWTVSAGASPAGYALSFDPPSFTLAPGYTQDVTFTVTNTGGQSTKFAYGRFDLVESGGLSPDQHLTVAVKGPQPVQDTSFEATTVVVGPNPFWDGLDTNVSAAGGTNFCNPFDCGAIPVRTGIWTVWFGGWGGGAETQYFSQNVTFPASGPQILNYWRRVTKRPDVAGTLTVSIDGTPVQIVNMSALAAVDAAYTHQSVDVSAYADGSAHLVKFEYVYLDPNGTGVDGNVFIDDVSIDPSNVVPFSTGTGLSGGAEKLTQ